MSPALLSPIAGGLATAEFRVASGDLVRLRARGVDLSDPWFHWFELTTNSQTMSPRGGVGRRGFNVGPRSAADTALQKVLNGRLRETVRFAGAEVVIGDAADGGQAFGAWTGPWHSVYGWFGPPLDQTASILGYFSGLRFADAELGVRVFAPRERFSRLFVTKQIPGVGMLRIHSGPTAAGLVPSWAGATVPAGEIWRNAHQDPDGQSGLEYVLATRSAVAILHPNPGFLDHREATHDHGFRPGASITPAELDRRAIQFLQRVVELSWTRDSAAPGEGHR